MFMFHRGTLCPFPAGGHLGLRQRGAVGNSRGFYSGDGGLGGRAALNLLPSGD